MDAFSSLNTNALLQAAGKGDAKLAGCLLQAGADVNIRDYWKSSPLLEASKSGSLECVRFLLEHGADSAAVSGDEDTVLTNAVRSGNMELVQFWLDRGFDVNARGRNTLELACSIESREMVELLLQAGAKVGDTLFVAWHCPRSPNAPPPSTLATSLNCWMLWWNHDGGRVAAISSKQRAGV